MDSSVNVPVFLKQVEYKIMKNISLNFYSLNKMRHLKNKTLLLICCILAGTVVPSYSQESYELFENKSFYTGLIFGSNFCQVDGDNFAGYHKFGFNIGGAAYIKLDEHITGSMEVLYSQKGSRSTMPQLLAAGFYITNYGITLNYAEIPVLINYYDDHKNHFGGGLSYGRLGTSKEYITTNPPTTYDPNDYQFKKNDLNLLLNGSLHVYKGLFVNLRFQYSLLSIRSKVPNITKGTQYNNLWTIRLMYLFL